MEIKDRLLWEGVFRHQTSQQSTGGLKGPDLLEFYSAIATICDQVVEQRAQKRVEQAAVGPQLAGARVGGYVAPPVPPAAPAPPAPAAAPNLPTPPGMKVIQVAGIGPVFVPESQPDPNASTPAQQT